MASGVDQEAGAGDEARPGPCRSLIIMEEETGHGHPQYTIVMKDSAHVFRVLLSPTDPVPEQARNDGKCSSSGGS
jgi:hypothetical protein